MADNDLATYVSLFAAAAAFVMIRRWRAGASVGLVFTYVFSFSTNYFLGAALYLLPWYSSSTVDLTFRGLRQSTFAVLAFTLGSEVAGIVLARRSAAAAHAEEVPVEQSSLLVDRRLIYFYLVSGIVLYGVILPIAGEFASLTAIAATGSTLAVVAIGLLCWNAFHAGKTGTFWASLAATTLLPVMTVLGQGFLGYGFAGMLTVLSFVASFYRPRWRILVLGVLLGYVGLSVYVTYMRDRSDIRAVVWGGASVGNRVTQAEDTFGNFEWFDIQNDQHLSRIEGRLDQDVLIGAAERYIDGGSATYARGETLWDAFLAIIPRALWPNKPITAGSGNLVSDYTGIHFMEGTSVGIGQVMEAYINFGTPGVCIFFLIIGLVLSSVDQIAHDFIVRADAGHFLIWYLPGLAILQVGGSFAEVTSSATAGILMAVGLNRVLRRTAPDRRNRARAIPGATGIQ